ncbi:MFS polyamine transporter [Gautieria morchelliformis]|nr:MFS polyamine transporter [Gautieria morchelliformis]
MTSPATSEEEADEKETFPAVNGALDHPSTLEAGMAQQSDVIIVGWDGPDDTLNPKTWSKNKKWAATAVVSSYTFISPIASSMMAPAAANVANEFHITNSVVLSMTVSIFVLAYVFNIACGFSRNTGQFLAFQFLAGLGGSAPLSVGGAVLADCWAPEQRGQAIAIYSLAPILGPCIGPIASAWIAERSTWRWVFWSTSIVCGCVQIFGFIHLRETFAPVLLEQRAKRLRKSMGLDPNDRHRVRIEYETPDRHWQQIFAKALLRPFTMFIFEPIIQLLATYLAFMYVFLVLVTLPDIFQNTYRQPVGIAGLHYLALGIGLTGASQINARLIDCFYKHFKEKNGGVGKPEFRLPSMFAGVFFLPIGLLIFGWTAQEHVFWIVPDIGIAFLGAGIVLIVQSVQTLAAVTCLRSLAGFGFPLFAPAIFGIWKGDTILAAFAMGVGIPAPFLFWRFGERIRSRSRYARKKYRDGSLRST